MGHMCENAREGVPAKKKLSQFFNLLIPNIPYKNVSTTDTIV